MINAYRGTGTFTRNLRLGIRVLLCITSKRWEGGRRGGGVYHYAQQLFEKRVAVDVKLFSMIIASARKHSGRVAVRTMEHQNLLVERKTPSDSSCLGLLESSRFRFTSVHLHSFNIGKITLDEAQWVT